MGESGTRCSEESRSNGHGEREERGNPDAPTDEVESLHQLPKAELRYQEGPLPATVHRPNPGTTGRIGLLLLSRRIFGQQSDCYPHWRSREDDIHMSFWHFCLQTHATQTVQCPHDLPTMHDDNLFWLSWRKLRSFHGQFLRLWKQLQKLSCSPDEDTGGMRQETTGTQLGEIPLDSTRGSSARAYRLAQRLRNG